MSSKRPNILLITSDQQHYSTLGAVNDRIRTPALDRLCAEGSRFDRAYCPNPTCTPTRATLITGMYPSQHGAWSLGTKLFEDLPTVGEMLSEAGYATGLIGKAHFQPLASRPGMESLECQPLLRDLDFWRNFKGPWYGFEHVETARMHADESHAGQHYAIWMEENGLANWADYFQPWPPKPNHGNGDRYFIAEDRNWDLPEPMHYSHWTGERTCAFLESAAAEDRPFFCWASFHDPHPPYKLCEPWASMYDPADMPVGRLTPGEHDANPVHFAMTQEEDPDFESVFPPSDGAIHGRGSHLRSEEDMRKDMAVYYGMVSLMDQEIGRILDKLDQLGQADDTLVVFTTDHGHFLGQHGLIAKAIHHYEDLLRVPMVIRWPGRTPGGAVSDDIQSLVDFAPTALAAAGLDAPGSMTGLDATPNWCGGEAVRNGAIVENHHGTRVCHLRTYVNRRYKITVYREFDDGELFDLQEDPGEVRNLWRDPASQELKKDMLLEFMQATLAAESMRMPRIAGA